MDGSRTSGIAGITEGTPDIDRNFSFWIFGIFNKKRQWIIDIEGEYSFLPTRIDKEQFAEMCLSGKAEQLQINLLKDALY